MIPISHILLLAATLFVIGLVIILIRRNAIMILIGVELLLNAANINFIAFSNLHQTNSGPGTGADTEGQFFSIFIIVIAACEAAVALAIIFKIYQLFNTSNLDEVDELKH